MRGADSLVALIRAYSPPAFPFPVSVRLPAAACPGADIRAYLFDVYGTLFVSASGDIGTLERETNGAEAAPHEAERVRRLLAPFGKDASLPDLKRRFAAAVTVRHERLSAKTAFPEIDVRAVWAGILGVSEDAAEEFALRFELAANPVFPMPGLEDTLKKCTEAGFLLGIVSNAQFFTPLLFSAFLGKTPEELGFLPELCVYSFREGEAKPGPALFRKAAAGLAARGLAPENALYTGNDMLNDVWAAGQAGFRTCLFAGDSRSLRLRPDDKRCAGMTSDFVATSLAGIPVGSGAYGRAR